MTTLEQTEQALRELLDSVDVTQSDVDGVDVYDLPPTNLPSKSAPKIAHKKTKQDPKYIHMDKFATKELKMQFVLSKMLNVCNVETLMELKEKEYLSIDYARPYKQNIGGPVIMIGVPSEVVKARDERKGRECFRELNSRFPLSSLLESLKVIKEQL